MLKRACQPTCRHWRMIARSADGSLRDALSLLDQALPFAAARCVKQPLPRCWARSTGNTCRSCCELLADGDAPGPDGGVADIDQQFPGLRSLPGRPGAALQRIAVYQVVGSNENDADLSEKN